MGSCIECTSWAAYFCQEPDQPDAFVATERAYHYTMVLHTSGTQQDEF